MKLLATALCMVLLTACVMAVDPWYQEPKVIKIIKPVHIVKVVKHIPPPIPVIKYVKFFHHTTVGHPIIPISHGHHGWW